MSGPGRPVVPTLGRHLLAEFWGCDRELLADPSRLETLLEDAARRADATPVQTLVHSFRPAGVTGVVVLEESHLSIHTWPEVGYAAVDLYTCGRCRPEAAVGFLEVALSASQCRRLAVRRGDPPPAAGPKVEAPGDCGDAET